MQRTVHGELPKSVIIATACARPPGACACSTRARRACQSTPTISKLYGLRGGVDWRDGLPVTRADGEQVRDRVGGKTAASARRVTEDMFNGPRRHRWQTQKSTSPTISPCSRDLQIAGPCRLRGRDFDQLGHGPQDEPPADRSLADDSPVSVRPTASAGTSIWQGRSPTGVASVKVRGTGVVPAAVERGSFRRVTEAVGDRR